MRGYIPSYSPRDDVLQIILQHALSFVVAVRFTPEADDLRILVARALLQLNLFRDLRLLGAFEQLDRMTRHDRGDRVLVDELRMTVSSQQHAKIIEPRDHALQFHSIDQKNGEWNFCFTNVVEEGVL